jgi:hypothetical protein
MEHVADLDAPCTIEELFTWVSDLARYPSWLGIVERAEPVGAVDGDEGPAWLVDLGARVGPFSRSKRLRMVRTELHAPTSVAFHRREVDRREHGTWILRAEVAPAPDQGSRLTMHLHYGGRLWGPVLEPILRDEIDRSRARLLALVGHAAP